jgi:hypothetical protein
MSGGRDESQLLSGLSRAGSTAIVELHFRDGEVIVAKRISVSESDALIAFELVSSNRAEKYEKMDKPFGGLIADISDLESFRVLPSNVAGG